MSDLGNIERFGRLDCMAKIAPGYDVLSYTGWFTQDGYGRIWRRVDGEQTTEHVCNLDQILGFTPRLSPEQQRTLIESEQNADIYDITTGKYLGKRKDMHS